ncbi:hypothetical protein HPP92_000883 [Vanilla planifolia]|uniref:Uncharacterized protein n=1 Tax=Vanilla planifolia TaxID=51239 RepID=A0A835RYV5_VANPL|nr:hypothetical protein HPP92_000883 [Vanilla planifolia]
MASLQLFLRSHLLILEKLDEDLFCLFLCSSFKRSNYVGSWPVESCCGEECSIRCRNNQLIEILALPYRTHAVTDGSFPKSLPLQNIDLSLCMIQFKQNLRNYVTIMG